MRRKVPNGPRNLRPFSRVRSLHRRLSQLLLIFTPAKELAGFFNRGSFFIPIRLAWSEETG